MSQIGVAMQWFGKAVGGIIGLVAAGPIGSVLGVLLGHQLDEGEASAAVQTDGAHEISVA